MGQVQAYCCQHREKSKEEPLDTLQQIQEKATALPPPLPLTEPVIVPRDPQNDEPDPSFATPELSANFLFPNRLENRLEQLRPFPYPDGSDIPKGKVLPNPYKLNNGAFYTGEWKAGQTHGKGMYVFPQKSLLACISKENTITGRGRIIYPNGDYYEGDIVNSKANGKGKYVQGKTTYEGEFRESLLHGKGREIGEGYKFQGEFDCGHKKNGSLTWKTDNRNFEYKGQFVNNMFEGRGTLITDDGRYVGEFKRGLKHGVGKFYYKNNRYYQGEFANDMRHGNGKIVDGVMAKVIKRGNWKNDFFVQ